MLLADWKHNRPCLAPSFFSLSSIVRIPYIGLLTCFLFFLYLLYTVKSIGSMAARKPYLTFLHVPFKEKFLLDARSPTDQIYHVAR